MKCCSLTYAEFAASLTLESIDEKAFGESPSFQEFRAETTKLNKVSEVNP
jgi:hypothetical protein